jgi:transposase
MDEREQYMVIEFLWRQEHGTKVIHTHWRGTLGAATESLPTVRRWMHRFREGDTSCEDKSRLDEPIIILEDFLSNFILKYSFVSAKIIAKHFDISGSTVKDLLIPEMGLRKFTQR